MAPRPRVRRFYSPADKDRALLELAVVDNSCQASRNLAAQGLEVPEQTLRQWKSRNPERFAQLKAEHTSKVEETMVEECQQTVRLAARAEQAGLALELERIGEKKVRDAGASARNASVIKGINVDKFLTLSNRPAVIVEKRDPTDIMRKLVELAPDVFDIEDGEVEELPPDGFAALAEGDTAAPEVT